MKQNLNEDPSKFTNKDVAERFWKDAKNKGRVETSDEQVVFHLSTEEAKKCRYRIVDMTQRMAECYVHRDVISHGVRLHPPHLWNIDSEGKVFHKVNDQWIEWTADIKQNISRFDS